MISYDFVTVDKFGKNGWPFVVLCIRVWLIGIEASKFLGVQGFLPKFSQTCPKSCRATCADRFCGVTSKKWSSLVFPQTFCLDT